METLGILLYRIDARQIAEQGEVANLAGVLRQLRGGPEG